MPEILLHYYLIKKFTANLYVLNVSALNPELIVYSLKQHNRWLAIWTDEKAKHAFSLHWEMFAARYKEIPPEYLSFNLVNEPYGVKAPLYTSIMKQVINVIRTYNAERIIYVDGLEWARTPVSELVLEGVVQAFHSYDPMVITHYKAEWINGSASWQEPVWPMHAISRYLYGPYKPEFQSTLIIKGNFPANTEVTININQVSVLSTLMISAGDSIIVTKKFLSNKYDKEASILNLTEWGYQNIYNKDYSVVLKNRADTLYFKNSEGDWLTFNSITIRINDTKKITIMPLQSWGSKQKTVFINNNMELTDKNGNPLVAFEIIENTAQFIKQNNIDIIVGEWGVYNRTPHPVTLHFMEDSLKVFQKHHVGWALWNLEGGFGILNSGRKDVDYVDYKGYKLDKKMLDLLQKY